MVALLIPATWSVGIAQAVTPPTLPPAATATDADTGASSRAAVPQDTAGTAHAGTGTDSLPTRGPLPTWSVRKAAIGLTATTGLLFALDRPILRTLRTESIHRSEGWKVSMAAGDQVGAPVAMAAGPLLFLSGRATHKPSLIDVGMHLTEAYAIAGAATMLIKAAAGRERPYVTDSTPVSSFKFGRGYPHRGPYVSFPSGHAMGAFTAAAVLTAEAHAWWPEHVGLVRTVAYGAALLDGVSRVYRDMHWASDVGAAATIGIVTGTLVVRHQHAHPDNRLDRLARKITFMPATSGGYHIAWTSTF